MSRNDSGNGVAAAGAADTAATVYVC